MRKRRKMTADRKAKLREEFRAALERAAQRVQEYDLGVMGQDVAATLRDLAQPPPTGGHKEGK